MLTLFQSNRFEILVEAMIATESAARADPFAPVEVIVPSAAVARRVELAWAQRHGVCANVRFCFLAEWLWRQISRTLTLPDRSPLAPEALAWRFYALLGAWQGETAGQTSGARLTAYLQGADASLRFELARRLARVFDHYQTYRSDWLDAWLAGESIFSSRELAEARPNEAQRDDEAWQAALWRAVPAAAEAGARRFLAAPAPPEPARVRAAVLGLSTMAPLHVALLNHLSASVDIGLYALNPCREYWYDIVGERSATRAALARGLAPGREGEDYRESGHPLLAEWGRQTRAYLSTLSGLTEGRIDAEASVFLENEQPTLLAAIQNGILALDPEPEVVPGEAAIEVHACHSLSRQLEVVHDRLLALFEAEPDLQPADILIAFPDLEAAAPLVDAVFGTVDESRRIPYRLSGLPPSKVSPLARAFLAWLAMDQTPPGVAELIEWLRVVPFARAYGIDADDLEAIQQALMAAGARSDFGAADGAPADAGQGPGHTLDDALMRLTLGYAMPDDAAPQDVWLPVAAPGAHDWLGGLCRAVDDLRLFASRLASTRRPGDWRVLLDWALARLFDVGAEQADELEALRAACECVFDSLGSAFGGLEQAEAAPGIEMDVAVVRQALAGQLDESARGGVPAGSVTCTALASLRQLPYRVICLLGMDDGALPSLLRADEFDLIAAFGRQGDRQRRDDERNLFLDVLLAARDRLIVGYTGRSIRDNAPLPPAALVDELLDYCARLRAGAQASHEALEAARAELLTIHPLQPFSSTYMTGAARFYTFDADRAEVARLLGESNRAPRGAARLFGAALDWPADADLTLDALSRFWRHPQRALLRERLGIAIDASDTLPEPFEPFVADFEGRDALARRVLPAVLPPVQDPAHDAQGEAAEARRRRLASALVAASPELPGGATGKVVRERELGAMLSLAARVAQARGNALSATARFALRVSPNWPAGLDPALFGLSATPDLGGATVLSGALDGVGPRGRIAWRYSRAHARALLAVWIEHLVFNALPEAALRAALEDTAAALPQSRETRWFGQGVSLSFLPVPEAPRLLGELLALYRLGLTRPLPFYPKSAHAWITRNAAAAQSVFEGGAMHPGEREDPAIELACGHAAGLGPDVEALAQRIFGPLCAHLRDAQAGEGDAA